MNIRNAKHNADGSIDCEIQHPKHGWIPFTAAANDIEEHGRAVHAAILSGDAGEIAPYEPPPPPDLAEVKRAARATVDQRFALAVHQFPWDFGGEIGLQHLQLRSVTDQANWLVALGKAERMVAAGQGAELTPTGIRTQENVTVPVTADQAVAVLAAVSTFGELTMARAWAIKDQINAAPDAAAVAAVLAAELEAGWPIDEM